MKRVNVLGVVVDNVSQQEALDRIQQFIQSGSSHLVVTLGTEMVMRAQNDAEFREIVNHASLVLPDGGGLLWASSRLGIPLKDKVAGIDLLESICDASQEKRWKIFFLGGKPGVVEKALQKLRDRFPKANVVGFHHGYFKNEEEKVVEQLRSTQPDVLFAGLGFPIQELWLSKHLSELKIPVGMGVGGSFDVLAGNLKRAPDWMIDLNLEWLFRFFQEPKRLGRILNIPIFMGKIYQTILKKKLRNE